MDWAGSSRIYLSPPRPLSAYNPHQYEFETWGEDDETSAELGLSVNGGKDGDVVLATSTVAVVNMEVGELGRGKTVRK